MKTLPAFTISVLFFLHAFGQAEKLKSLYEQGKYDDLIKYKPGPGEDIPAKSFYYIGMAYYMKEDDKNALKYLDEAINKGPADYDMYFYKGMVLLFMKKYQESLALFNNAIYLLPGEPDGYSAKAEAFSGLNNTDSARFLFEKATQFTNCKPRVFLLLAELYQNENKNEEALRVFKTATDRTSPGTVDHQTFSYNVGLMQQLGGDSVSARLTFEKHLSQYPDDYRAIARLIQAYYSLEEYDKAKSWKNVLYDAYKKKVLPDEMKSMFCFHQFLWNGKRVMVFEHFAEPGNEALFVKHNFYVMKDDGSVDYQVRSESSAAVRMTPTGKYVLCLVKDNSYSTFWDYVFNDDYKYSELKQAVLNILNKAVKPAAKTVIGN